MKDISVVIPACNEYPQLLFTLQSLEEELKPFDYELLVVDNYGGLPEKEKEENIKNKSTDKTKAYFSKLRNPRVRYLEYSDRLSHWQAKNYGIKNSDGGLLFFVDAHCIIGRDSLREMAGFMNGFDGPIGGLHCLIHYMLDSRPLEYEFQPKRFGYRFCTALPRENPYVVPVMSCCGVMCRREVFDKLGGWNKELGIYGGGESYINWKQATCGFPQYIHPKARVWHFAEKRGYSWNYNDFVRNYFIAAYCVGGEKWLEQQFEVRKAKGDRVEVLEALKQDVLEKCRLEREFIASRQKMSFDEYIKSFE